MDHRRWQKESWKTKEDMVRYAERRFELRRWVWSGVTRERLPAIVPNGDNSSPDLSLEQEKLSVSLRTGILS